MNIPSRFVRFLGAEATATATHYATLITLVGFGVAALPASAAGSAAGLLTRTTASAADGCSHQSDHNAPLSDGSILVSALAFFLNSLLMWAGLALGLHYLVAQILSTIFVMLVNYVLHANWTFMNGAMR
ncbi:GtrA family protein (plasmid) [Cupriavidus basilensis]